MKKYVDVILPLPLSNLYTYSLAEEMQEDVDVGFRVVVPFGKKKYYTAIVAKVHYDKPQEYEVKEVSEVLDNHPVILADQLELWRWIASYYLCTLGDVYKAAIPSGLKIESETVIVYNKEFESSSPLSDKEQIDEKVHILHKFLHHQETPHNNMASISHHHSYML